MSTLCYPIARQLRCRSINGWQVPVPGDDRTARVTRDRSCVGANGLPTHPLGFPCRAGHVRQLFTLYTVGALGARSTTETTTSPRTRSGVHSGCRVKPGTTIVPIGDYPLHLLYHSRQSASNSRTLAGFSRARSFVSQRSAAISYSSHASCPGSI